MESVITPFTPGTAALGGLLIGLAAAVMLLFNGKIMGASGIIGQTLDAQGPERLRRLAFLVGTLAGAGLVFLAKWLSGEPWGGGVTVSHNIPLLVVGGLLVGFGTRLGSGCTSGHGICGVSRFSLRSIVAVATFMLSGFITVYLIKHVLGA
jgi:uncharacterized membrane protein YedE/YeeE